MSDDYIGRVFGKLTVLAPAASIIKDKRRNAYLCSCECGNKKVIVKIRLPYLKSCGCILSHSDPEAPRMSSARQVHRKYNDGDLSFEDFMLLSQKLCHYCGAHPSNKRNMFKYKRSAGRSCSDFAVKHGDFIYNGLDRKNNNLPHNKNNIVPCCWRCNNAKGTRTLREFKAWIRKVYRHIEMSKS